MKRPVVLALLFLLAAATLVAAPLIGMHEITPQALWEGTDATAMMIFWQLRVPRVLMAMLAGAALAASGMTFQALFRNPLAEPFTLGVASGASLGAMIYLHLGFAFSFLTVSGVAWFAFAGAVLAIAMVFSLTRLKPGFSSATLLLAGVAINFFFSSLILLVQYLSDFTQSYVMLRWMMGGLGRIVEFDDFFTMLPLVVAGTLIVAYFTHELNLISTGEDLAASRGVEVERTKAVLFFAVSLVVGAVVAVCGPIGFVGLMAPHICRLLIGPDHRWLLAASLVFGGVFLTLCDTLARTMMAPTELPVGILTALVGGPFFLWLLMRKTPSGE